MITQIEKTILSAYLNLEYFNRATTAHISSDFFESEEIKLLAKECIDYTTKHNSLPTKTILKTIVEQKFGLRESQFQTINSVIDLVFEQSNVEDIKMSDSKWLLDTAENWCIERSAFNAVLKSMDILEGKGYDGKVKLEKSIIPDLLQKAISISFDSSIGHDYIEDVELRYDNMHQKVSKIPFKMPIFNKITDGGVERKTISNILAGTGCHARGTKILLNDGSLKNVEDISVSDVLVGDDGMPRYINHLVSGRADMYKITNNATKESMVVNGEHILSLYDNVKKNVCNISVNDYMLKGNDFKHHNKAYSLKHVAQFTKKELKIDPYFMGIYLGDGSTHNISFTNMDKEVLDYFYEYIADRYPDAYIRKTKKDNTDCMTHHVSCFVHGGWGANYNQVGKDFSEYGLSFGGKKTRTSCGEKFIPNEYKTSSVEDRLQILAGLLDTDGSVREKDRASGSYEYSSKSKQLVEDVVFIARSLACRARMVPKIVNGATYYRAYISMSDNTPEIPCKVPRKKLPRVNRQINPLHSSFTVEPVGVDDYFGFNISGNQLYCTGDFLVTHNCGKSMLMCSLAADYISQGYDVLYITLEMSEDKISQRIDANLLDVELSYLKNIPKEKYLKKVKGFADAGYGKLIVKEYPTSSASSANFRYLLQELEVKQGFIPSIVFLDYMGIATSARVRSAENTYLVQKCVSEEFRGLAVEKNFAGWTASQLNRGGNGSSDFDMTDISDSFATNMIFDFILGLISTDELVQLGQLRIKQLKNRYTDPNNNNTFLVNVTRAKMKVYEEGYQTSYKVHKKEDTPEYPIDDNNTPFVFDKSMIRPKKTVDTNSFIV